MAIEVRHSPSARTAATANYEAALLQWGEAERRRQLAEQLQRDQMAQQAALSREGMSLQDLMQRRSIADAQKRQLVGIQGQYGLQDDQQMYNAEQAFYDRNQQLGMAQLSQAYNVENREDQQAYGAGQADINRAFQAQTQGAAQDFQREMQGVEQGDRVNEIMLRYGLGIQGEQVQYDAQVRRQLEQFDREQEAVDAAYNNGQLTPQEYEQATRQVEQRRMNVQLKPPTPESRPEDELVPYGGSYVMRNPETGQWEFARNAPKEAEPKQIVTPKDIEAWAERENARRAESAGLGQVYQPVTFEEKQAYKREMEALYSGDSQFVPQGPQLPQVPEPTPEQIAQTTNQYGPIVQGMNPDAVKALATKPPEIQQRIVDLFPGPSAMLLNDFMLLPPNVQGDVLAATQAAYTTYATSSGDAKEAALAQYVNMLSQAIAEATQPQGSVQ